MDLDLLKYMLDQAERAEAKALEDLQKSRNETSRLEVEMMRTRQVAGGLRQAYLEAKKELSRADTPISVIRARTKVDPK
jgi:hypothetical protein